MRAAHLDVRDEQVTSLVVNVFGGVNRFGQVGRP
jgi:hypothetical protein